MFRTLMFLSKLCPIQNGHLGKRPIIPGGPRRFFHSKYILKKGKVKLARLNRNKKI
jgi:hypothetical protein